MHEIIVETQTAHFAEPFPLRNGETLPELTVAYETYGVLNEAKDNAIWICHALSGDAHCAGRYEDSKKFGWWDTLVGPGRKLDTNKYFVVCSNVLGGCSGTTGPSSINPRTGKPYGLDFPVISIADMVAVQKRLLDYLGIPTLHAVVGGSMGGMQAMQWAISYPDIVHNLIVIASCVRHTPQQIAFNEVGRRAIVSDPNWKSGHYYGTEGPSLGLAVARMIGHITYLSETSMMNKFGRRVREAHADKFEPAFEVETYLSHQGSAFVGRFDANSYLYITKALDTFDLASEGGTLGDTFARFKGRTLLISFTSDWLYPSIQLKETATAIRIHQGAVTYCDIETDYGHDSFLLKNDQMESLIEGFLASRPKDRTAP